MIISIVIAICLTGLLCYFTYNIFLCALFIILVINFISLFRKDTIRTCFYCSLYSSLVFLIFLSYRIINIENLPMILYILGAIFLGSVGGMLIVLINVVNEIAISVIHKFRNE